MSVLLLLLQQLVLRTIILLLQQLLKEGDTDPQAAQANSIMAEGSAGKQDHVRRQRRPTELWPEAAKANSIMALCPNGLFQHYRY